jgi:transcription-repair coupling factor (superfamily II helicase)
VPGRAFAIFRDKEETFRKAFSYEHTEDQARAIEEIFQDMEEPHPMDRLLSGDVGFGKTEVAMNAIYKAYLSGVQTALISPLLVLADEHYETLTERLSPFGVKVGIMTRMQSEKEIRETLRSLKDGSIHVVVGTHRLLSDDIIFAKLGLLIIDEEHKFGVTHKEKIKKMRVGIDILALSATPIPRSLNLALSGVKKISILATPPKKKKPIETIVTRWDERMIKNAIIHELTRSGQVIIIFNRIRGIESIKEEILLMFAESAPKAPLERGADLQRANQGGAFDRNLTPLPLLEGVQQTPKIVVTHGQMPGDDIEDRIHAFKKHKYDILLTTTIIENGVNFLSANTILIIDPEDFGLASLHQLRGRVGRKDQEGYCYLIYRKTELSKDEKHRLITIANNNHLGAGFEIAMRDMEIRGAGDVLGIKQAGKSKDV